MGWRRTPVAVTPSTQQLGHLNDAARAKFEASVQKFASDLLDEAERLEAGTSTAGGAPEITSSIVDDANLLVRRAYRRPPRSMVATCAQIWTGAALIVVGVATNHLDKGWGQIVFAISVAAAMIGTLVFLLKEAR